MTLKRRLVVSVLLAVMLLASLAGVTLGKPTYITESISTPYPQPYLERGGVYAMEEAPVTEISAGELEVVVSVHITYAIE